MVRGASAAAAAAFSPQALSRAEVVPHAPAILELEEADGRLAVLDDGAHAEALHRGVGHLRRPARTHSEVRARYCRSRDMRIPGGRAGGKKLPLPARKHSW